jgi:IclR family acetate operon transcriptional repressor
MTADDTTADTGQRYRVRSLGRALDLLDRLAERRGEGARLTELAKEVGLSKAATYAILQTLLARGLIGDIGQGASRRYRLGMGLAWLGDRATATIPLVDLAMPELRRLSESLGLTSRVAVLDQGYAMVVGRVDGPGVIRFDAALGRRELPHCSAVGKALLAALPGPRARDILRRLGLPRRTPRTMTKIGAVMADLDRIVARGYALDDEEDTEGVICVGSCVFDRQGEAIGAISVTSLKGRDWSDREAGIAARVIEAADAISRRVGGHASAEAWRRLAR